MLINRTRVQSYKPNSGIGKNLFMKKVYFYLFCFVCCSSYAKAEDGYRLWLRYNKVSNPALLSEYRASIKQLAFTGTSPTMQAAREEISNGHRGLLGIDVPENETILAGTLLIGTPASSKAIAGLDILKSALKKAGKEGYVIRTLYLKGKLATVIAGNTDIGVLYGVFNFLKLLQTQKSIKNLAVADYPRIQYRLLDHWDNLPRPGDTQTGTIERGYGGRSLWD